MNGVQRGEYDLGNRLREIIGSESIRSFALRANLKPSTVQSILGGGRPIVDNLVALADAAGVSVEWLATGRGERHRADTPRQPADQVERRLDEIRQVLTTSPRVPLQGDQLERDDELWPIYAELQMISRDEGAAPERRAAADNLLRIAFEDAGAERRQEKLLKETATRLREAYAMVDRAIQVVGREPSRLTKEALRTATFRYGIQLDDLVLLLGAVGDEVTTSVERASAEAPSRARTPPSEG